MFQVIVMWNLSRPDQEMADSIQDIKFRGYKPEAFLTGEFAVKLSTGGISSLSVSNIADRYCPTRRDLYFVKGINRLTDIRDTTTWGRVAGNIVERYLERILGKNTEHDTSYSFLIEDGGNFNGDFVNSNSREINRLRKIEKEAEEVKIGDTDWLVRLLSNNGRAELGLKLLHSSIKEDDSVDVEHIKIKTEIQPKPERIGISSLATPHFIIADFSIVGDIKTGVEFKPFHQLTCAGYALAYENQFGENSDINWGVIYFFPTRNPSAYVRPLTFAQIYIFPIDDNLRRWFINVRDEAYNIISKTGAPSFPPEEERSHCYYCRFKEYCIGQGLELVL